MPPSRQGYARLSLSTPNHVLVEEDGETDIVKIMGFEMVQNDKSLGTEWQFVLVFPVEDPKLKDSGGDPKMTKAQEKPTDLWKTFFLKKKDHRLPPEIKEGITIHDFNRSVFRKIADILQSMGCEVHHDESIDGDEVLLKVALADPVALKKHAEKVEARGRLTAAAYEAKDHRCPTDNVHAHLHAHGKEKWKVETQEQDLHGNHIDNSCPAHVRFSVDKAHLFEEFTEADKLRILRRAIFQHVNVPELQKAEVIKNFYVLHKWERVDELYRRGWCNPLYLCKWPHEALVDYLVPYMGVQVSYFFHLFNCFTRWVCFPAVLSVGVYAARMSKLLDDEQVQLMNTFFGVLLCVWTTAFLVIYQQQLSLKTLRWGMEGASSEIAAVRKEFVDIYRGTAKEMFQQLFHWLLCVVFICETVGAVFFLSDRRREAIHDPEGEAHILGISALAVKNAVLVPVFKYMITVNIKVVDAVWTMLSTYLSKKENWRTDPELKSNMVVKLFAVKSVIFYYPFVYTMLIQPTVEGCDGGEIRGCLEKLRSDLQVFFITQVISEAAVLLVALAQMYYQIHTELQNASSKGGKKKKLGYLEVQAKAPPYDMANEIDDYMKVVLNFGFISMFGVTTPVICILCFLANFPLKRLLAYKLCFAHQRVMPRVQEGIGSWRSILNFVAYAGVTSTCYVVIFVFDLGDFTFGTKMVVFVLAERAVMVLKFAMEAMLGSKAVAQLRVEEYNDDVVELILDDDKDDDAEEEQQ